MILLLEFSSLRELQLILQYFKLKKITYPVSIDAIWKNAINTCNSHCIVRIKNSYWNGYNSYAFSGPGRKDDWSKLYNVPIYTIDYAIKHFPELFI